MKKIMSIFGTRPEAIKMCPLVKKIEKTEGLESIVVVTGQHREMLDQVLNIFDVKPDYDLNIMKANQTLSDITSRLIVLLEPILKKEKPDLLLVHGDTTTSFASALTAFYNNVRVGHVEAGLRTYDKFSPFPEEMNRQLTGKIADLHFSPTELNKKNLMDENIKEDDIYLTGNTVIDALMMTVDETYHFDNELLNSIDYDNERVVLLTAHRRENFGQPMKDIFEAINKLTRDFNVKFIYPVHLNPNVRNVAYEMFEGNENVILVEPLDYNDFSNLMNKVYMVMTDSGGLQEEAPALGKPVLVLRTETERPEAVSAGTVKVAGINKETIYELAEKLINDEKIYSHMSKAINPYGTGDATDKIVKAIKEYFEK